MSFFYTFFKKSITTYFTLTSGYFLLIYSLTAFNFDYVRAVRIMLKFYFAKENANYFPIPSEEPVINTHEF
jgi:hypothetical protein